MIKSIRPFLWFSGGKAEEATRFYTSVFPNSSIENVGEMSTSFTLSGQKFMALNGDEDFPFTEAISMFVTVETQPEVDHLWNELTGDGGTPVQCGWLKDKYGLFWQIIPERLMDLIGNDDEAVSKAALGAMMKMVKIDIAELDAAVDESRSAR